MASSCALRVATHYAASSKMGEIPVAPQSVGGTSGTVNFSTDPKQSCMYVLNRQNLTEITRIGGSRQAGQFHWPHVVANDSDGNMYVGEVAGAARTQKFLRYGATGCSGTGNADVGKYTQYINRASSPSVRPGV